MKRDDLKKGSSSKFGQKRGASHVEVMLAFLIFLTFLAFLYSILEPTIQLGATKQPVLDFLKFSLENEFYIERVSTTTLVLDLSKVNLGSKTCIRIQENEGNEIEDGITDLVQDGVELLIKDSENNILTYEPQGSNNIKIGPLDDSFNGLIYIYYAEGLETSLGVLGGSSNCEGVDEGEYSLGYQTTEEEISQSKIEDLITEYNGGPGSDSYETLKAELGIPEGNDFWFSFELASGPPPIEPEGIVIPNVDVYATILPVQYIDYEANLQIGYMTLKIW